MQYVILDLEWNSGYSKKKHGFINEIIEIGAVKLDERMNIVGQFSIFVRPNITKRLNSMVKELTQITNEELLHGATFDYAVSKFKRFSQGCVIMSWSTSDLNALETNCEYYYGSSRIPFLKYYADVQAYCQSKLSSGGKNQIALRNAADILDIRTSDIPLHRAVGDSILTARILKNLYDADDFKPYIKFADNEFYDRLNFHSTYLYSIDNPLIDRSELYINCERCGVCCNRLEDWKIKSKAFTSSFECPSCKAQYKGRVQFKLLYDGITVTRRTSPFIDGEQSSKNNSQKQA